MTDPTIAVRAFLPLAEALRLRDVVVDEFFAGYELPSPFDVSWDERVPVRRAAGIWEHAAHITKDPWLPLHAAEHIGLTSCDVVSSLSATSETLRDAIRRHVAYFDIVTDALKWQLDVTGDLAFLSCRSTLPGPPQLARSLFCLGHAHHFLRLFGPKQYALQAVTLEHRDVVRATELDRFFRAELQFGAIQDALVFDAALLSAPMRRKDPELSELLSRYAAQALSAVAAPSSYRERVRFYLQNGQNPGVAAIAGQLGTSARSLQRALAREGTTYAELLDSERRATAERLLRCPSVPLSEVAYAAGFADPSSFHRAVRRWFRAGPQALRNRFCSESAPRSAPNASAGRASKPARSCSNENA